MIDNKSNFIDAITDGNKGIVEFLLDEGVDANYRQESTSRQSTALILACRYNHSEVAELLIERNANANEEDKISKCTALMESVIHGNIDIIKILLNKKAIIDHKDHYGSTALTYACWYGHQNIAKLLVSKGANLKTTNNFHIAPLYMYGQLSPNKINENIKLRYCKELENMWEIGIHPDACWARRKFFMIVLVENGFYPLLYRQLLKIENLKHNVYLKKVFGNKDLTRYIFTFL
jgi:ankyrin repeat protein